MDQVRLSRWLKAIIIGTGICGTVIYFLAIPMIGKAIVSEYPEACSWYWPWLIFLWLTAVPCYIALVSGWKIAADIGRDRSFSFENAKRLKLISILAAADSILAFAGNLVFYFLNMTQAVVFFMGFFIVFVGIALSVVFAALSHMVLKAAKLREENELTI
jgi:MFS family permease